ncbi:hypothetical protein ACFFUP_13490 [Vibrio ostreicida]|uniref:Methyl-accepting chemotaxis protein n=1 Tax=Vibrio ostreicida TaxID=526588 RepID=A0ABT8BZ28_9VIBR|nr:hypothetical protein [Vibrio ostreicida]MDN3611631.1 hypothetical protein [Vibrio ostreicida]NPD09120.1 hypothetical protein [Vibrio ostreicida]
MNKPQSAMIALLLSAVSFNAVSALVKLTGWVNTVNRVTCVSVGDVIEPNDLQGCTLISTVFGNEVNKGPILSVTVASSYLSVTTSQSGGNDLFYYSDIASCPDGEVPDPATGQCGPACPDGQQPDPVTGECVEVAYCDLSSTWDEIFSAEMACAESSGIFRFSCSDFLDTLDMSCTQPRECVIGMPTYPECLGDIDPTDPITPPDGGFNPGTPPTSNPSTPSFEKPEPDHVTPTDSTDTAVLEGIQNLNRDNNNAFNALNTDVNKGFSDVNNALNQSNAYQAATGVLISEQMNQDYALHQANKAAQLQTTGAVMSGTDATVSAISGQTGALGSKLDDIASLLGDSGEAPCDPLADPRGCEGDHGLKGDFIETISSQLGTQFSSDLNDSEGVLMSTIQGTIDSPLTVDMEVVGGDAKTMLMESLGFNSGCQPLTLGSHEGSTIELSCSLSEQIKVILSFLIGAYTIMTLFDILLNGITPAGIKPSATRHA